MVVEPAYRRWFEGQTSKLSGTTKWNLSRVAAAQSSSLEYLELP